MGSGIIGLFLESGWVGKVIVVILLAVSIVTWAMILLKYQFLRKAEQESHRFMSEFRKNEERAGTHETRRVEEVQSHCNTFP